jgi:hypothetical protein
VYLFQLRFSFGVTALRIDRSRQIAACKQSMGMLGAPYMQFVITELEEMSLSVFIAALPSNSPAQFVANIKDKGVITAEPLPP